MDKMFQNIINIRMKKSFDYSEHFKEYEKTLLKSPYIKFIRQLAEPIVIVSGKCGDYVQVGIVDFCGYISPLVSVEGAPLMPIAIAQKFYPYYDSEITNKPILE